MNEQELYRADPIEYDAFLTEDGGLDVEAWIVRSTYEIWDLQLIGRINYYYADDCVIHTSAGETVDGTDAIIKDTTSWQSAFPDLRIDIRDVLWEGNAEDGYKTSMPWSFVGTNTGHSKYGSPTGKELTRQNNLGIANCLIERVDGRWRYTEEWSNYDSAAMKRVCTPDHHDGNAATE